MSCHDDSRTSCRKLKLKALKLYFTSLHRNIVKLFRGFHAARRHVNWNWGSKLWKSSSTIQHVIFTLSVQFSCCTNIWCSCLLSAVHQFLFPLIVQGNLIDHTLTDRSIHSRCEHTADLHAADLHAADLWTRVLNVWCWIFNSADSSADVKLMTVKQRAAFKVVAETLWII